MYDVTIETNRLVYIDYFLQFESFPWTHTHLTTQLEILHIRNSAKFESNFRVFFVRIKRSPL